MPVRFEINDGQLHVRQSFDFPAVYLDHWAVRRFSSNSSEGERFTKALRLRRGALVISHTNLAEITGPSDQRHTSEIASFLQGLLPNIFFAIFAVESAIRQEKMNHHPNIRLMAPPDLELLRIVGRERPNDLAPFTIIGITNTIAKHRDRLGETWHKSNQALADQINHLRRDPKFVGRVRSFEGHIARIPTLAIMQELLRPIYLDDTMPIDRNDAGDIHHAVLSIAYCDFVLLDGKWEDFHQRMKRRFAELGVNVRTAAVFSARRHGVVRFLEALETAPPFQTSSEGTIDTRS